MKKIWILSLLLVGCGSMKGPDSRHPNSKSFSCKFEEVIEGKTILFNFIPEDQVLLVSSKKSDDSKIPLEESDFSAGGFIYKEATGGSPGVWDLKLELVSYKDDPEVKLLLKKSPLSKSIVQTSKKCSRAI